MSCHYDCLVVGGGVVGLALAWELAGRKLRVGVADRGEPGTGASWVGAGILPPPHLHAPHEPLESLRQMSHELHVAWSKQLLADTGIDNELRACGGLYFARRPAESVALRVAMQEAAAEGVVVEALSQQELIGHEPNLAAVARSIVAAYRLPGEMQIRAPRYLKALQVGCQLRGVEVLPHTQIEQLETSGSRVVYARHAAGLIEATNVCIAGGSWSPTLLAPLGLTLAVEPWRGQLILWKTPSPMLSHVVNEGYRYLVPRADGHLLAGATIEDVGFDSTTTDEATRELQDFSRDFLPELTDQQALTTVAGLRPRTPDGRPFLDRVPGLDNLFVATGHYRNGLHISPATAVLMADMISGQTPRINLTPFRLGR